MAPPHIFSWSDPICVLDAGARGDLSWLNNIASYSHVYAFDPDPEAIAQLSEKYKKHPFKNLKLFQEALGKNNAETILYKTARPSMSSLLTPQPGNYELQYSLYEQKSAWQKNLNITEEIRINCTGIDEFIKRENIKSIDLLKLDTQGSELDILKSAEQTIKSTGIRTIITEVSMIPVYKNQTLFSTLDLWLRDHDYIIADYRVYPSEPWHKNKSIIKNERAVYATSGDAIYFLNPDNPNNYSLESAEKTALIMAMLGYTSVAYYLLTKKAGWDHENALTKLRSFDKQDIKERLKSFVKKWLPPAVISMIKKGKLFGSLIVLIP